MTAQRQQPNRSQVAWHSLRKSITKHWQFYLMALPAVVAILLFGYGPLFGLVIAFQEFSPFRGISGSDWIGFENFRDAFASPFFWTAFRNSLVISALKLAIGFPTAIILPCSSTKSACVGLRVSCKPRASCHFLFRGWWPGTMFGPSWHQTGW